MRFLANRVRDEEDLARLRAGIGKVFFVVPEDRAILDADRDGRSPLDTAPRAPAVANLVAFARELAAAR